MNCRQFEELARDLIRNVPMEVSERQTAISHARECGVCRLRLEDERALSAGLSALAMSNLNEAASINVETSLRSAFSAASAAQGAEPGSGRVKRRTWMIAAAAAAILIFVTLFVIKTRKTPAPPDRASRPQHENAPKPAPQQHENAIATPGPENRPRQKRSPAPSASNRKDQVARAGSPVTSRPARGQAATPTEVTTSFIPLARAADAKAIDSWRLVRAEVPKSSLTMFGLPVNWDSPEDRITADFLVGNDGLAYAVRFVR